MWKTSWLLGEIYGIMAQTQQARRAPPSHMGRVMRALAALAALVLTFGYREIARRDPELVGRI
jgi:hypothetical protein